MPNIQAILVVKEKKLSQWFELRSSRFKSFPCLRVRLFVDLLELFSTTMTPSSLDTSVTVWNEGYSSIYSGFACLARTKAVWRMNKSFLMMTKKASALVGVESRTEIFVLTCISLCQLKDSNLFFFCAIHSQSFLASSTWNGTSPVLG